MNLALHTTLGTSLHTDSGHYSYTIFLPNTAFSYSAAALVYNAAANVYNPAALVYNATANVYNPAALVYNAAANVYNPAANVYNPTASVYNAAANVYNPAASVYNATANVYNRPALVFNATDDAVLLSAIRKWLKTQIAYQSLTFHFLEKHRAPPSSSFISSKNIF